MDEVLRTVVVGENGTILVPVAEFLPGQTVEVTIRLALEPEYESADSNPDVEDFA